MRRPHMIRPGSATHGAMRLSRPFLALLPCLALTIGGPVLAVPVPVRMASVPAKADGSISVTSEGPEYCAGLGRLLDRRLATPRGVPAGAMDDSRRLRREGDQLCRHGHSRAGIARLRRALVLLDQSEKQP